jgi:surface antigen
MKPLWERPGKQLMRRSPTLFYGIFLCVLGATPPVIAGDATFFGTGLGAAFGGLFGSQFGRGAGNVAATGTGVVIGGLVGNSIGQSIDNDHARASYMGNGVAVSNQSVSFSANAYMPNYVAPPAPPPTSIDQQAGTYCRPYSQAVNIGGRLQESYGTACLQPDGTWRTVP